MLIILGKGWRGTGEVGGQGHEKVVRRRSLCISFKWVRVDHSSPQQYG